MIIVVVVFSATEMGCSQRVNGISLYLACGKKMVSNEKRILSWVDAGRGYMKALLGTGAFPT